MPKDQTAVMCHNIAKYNREHQQPDLTPLEAAEMLEDIAVVSDLKAVDGKRSGVVKIGRVDAEDLRIAASYLRKIAAGEYKPVVHAHWKLVSESTQCDLVKCTHCGRSIAVARNVPLDEWRAAKPYCDQCGALMNGKSDDHA
ncbi:hypothetical protein [Caproiciproducens galactitolivorans]|uniref:Uncharacterized protein n=1 Tax=Caproiciproducens galactitolivorans TaxID=642589 RepID=A0ABT4BY08_9FIRM|nr:hypothetical protein [Caproiciproducens galactitolivorans]MCY1715210.1 hypothetical protein [Caproiciproducens galactitolivorans]